MRVRLIHWNAAQRAQRAELLRRAGFSVDHGDLDGSNYRTLRESPPGAFIIDLSRLPSHGREIALALREWKDTRRVPILLVEGSPEKVEKLRSLLPDAVYTTWRRIRGDLKRAAAAPPVDPVVPSSRLAGYSGTPLPKKLGIKPGSKVVPIGAPRGFAATLGELPDGARVATAATGRPNAPHDLVIWFVRSRDELRLAIKERAAAVGPGGLWIAWPKKTSRLAGDVGERDVREIGLASGLVDYKVCAIDPDWSGLKFARRKPPKA